MTPAVDERLARTVGAVHLGDDLCRFRVWAPFHEEVMLHVVAPEERLVTMSRDSAGYFEVVAKVPPGGRYFFRFPNGEERPDPASRFQPEGVHGPSEVVSRAFEWSDQEWRGLSMRDYILYELHVGTFSSSGTFDGVIAQLDRLKDVGVTAIEIMPVAQFPGSRNWGYDGVYLSAVQNSYGGPHGLKTLVNAAHARGLAVVLDVVYNHLGPEGNYLGVYGPYFTDRYKTPWGLALNFDGSGSDEVRRFFIDNALMWIDEFHVDGLRLDAVHAIIDHTASPFIGELAAAVHARAANLGRQVQVIAESDLNDPRLIHSREEGGYGLDGQWSDDFHHSLHALVTGEGEGYYCDYGAVDDLATVFTTGYRFTGQYSEFRGRRFGAMPKDVPTTKFVVCAQNHDQIGNRMKGDRLAASLSDAQLRLSAAAVLLSPFTPLLFMGEEYGEKNPFRYFTSHGDQDLIEAVRRGRREEFSTFAWEGEVPDPHDEATFLSSVIDVDGAGARGESLLAFHRELIAIRRNEEAFSSLRLGDVETVVRENERLLLVMRRSGEAQALLLLNFGPRQEVKLPLPRGQWRRRLSSADLQWGDSGSEVAEAISSHGEVTVTLAASECVVLIREGV